MEITVNKQLQRFYLATDEKWISGAGHEIRVGKYRFSAIPASNRVTISEVNTGVKLKDFPVSPVLLTLTKDELMVYFELLGERIKTIIEKTDNFDKLLEVAQKQNDKKLGPMPKIEDVYL